MEHVFGRRSVVTRIAPGGNLAGPESAAEAGPDSVPFTPAEEKYEHLAPIGSADAYDLLCSAGPLARMKALDELLTDVEAINAFRLQNP